MFLFRALRRTAVGLIILSSAFSSAHSQSPSFKKWINEDVRWIISKQERADFEALRNDQQRIEFVKGFWLRRDPTPDTVENEFKEEHYRRLAFANQHFAEEVAGSGSDRGSVYIMYGPPDRIDRSGPSAIDKVQGAKEFLQPISSEIWVYKHGIGSTQAFTIQFADKCSCGKYKLVSDTPQLP